MRPRIALAVALAAIVPGCAVTLDGLYHLVGPNSRASQGGSALGTGEGERWREIAVDTHGLMCRDVEVPMVRTASITTAVTNPNGWKGPMQFFTVVEAITLGLIIGVHEHTCATEGCSARTGYYPWLAPVAADLAWGTYRSFTIHNTIIRSSELGWQGPSLGEAAATMPERCAVGTEIPLYAGGDQLVVHVGDDGRTLATELELIGAFIAGHATFAVGGPHIKLDAAGAPGLVASLRRAREPVVREPMASVPVATPPAPPRAVIRWGLGLPTITGVRVDFELSAVCRGDADCASGQRCADRGDGVPLCLGPRNSHGYCTADADCASNRCMRRPDGVGACVR